MPASHHEAGGFDEKTIRGWLKWFELDKRDHALADLLHRQVIVPHVDEIVEDYLGVLCQNPQLGQEVGKFSLQELKRNLTASLLTLGVNFDTPDYFNARLRTGLFYSSTGASLRLFHAAYLLLQQVILRHVPAEYRQQADVYEQLASFVLKITSLSMSLAAEAYYRRTVQGLEQSVGLLRGEAIQLQQQARMDDLTRIANRREILDALQRWAHISSKQHTPLCLIMADIDLFKSVNDNHGHVAGDEVLRHVTQRIQSVLRANDVVGRYGGEEFLIILPETALATAKAIAERIRARVAECPVRTHGKDIPITISLGVSALRKKPDILSLIEQADAAMYEAKRIGRNRVVVRAIR